MGKGQVCSIIHNEVSTNINVTFHIVKILDANNNCKSILLTEALEWMITKEELA